MKLVKKIMLLFVMVYLTCNVSAFENEFTNGSVYFNDKKCTVYDAELKVGEPATIKAVVYLKKNVDVSTVIDATGFNRKEKNQPFEVIEGPSEFAETAREFGHNAGEKVTFEWIVQPTDVAAGWTIPLNIIFTFYDRDEKEGIPIKFTAANIMVHDEQYSGPAPTRTTTAPSSTDQTPSQGSPGFGVAGAHALNVGWGVVCGGLTSTIPPPGLSAIFHATAARQGGRVAASLVDSFEFRTADKRRYCS